PKDGQRGEERPETVAGQSLPERARAQSGTALVELRRGGEGGPPGRLGRVDRLEQAIALRTVTDPVPATRRPHREGWLGPLVDASRPGGASEEAIALRVDGFEERLGQSVALLLPEVGLPRGPPVVPHDRRRAEGEPVTALEQLPADVHVIPGGRV